MKQLLILSGKGGTGKTTIASAFIKLSKAKAYADCDVDAPNLHLITDHRVESSIRDYYNLPKAKINPELCTRCNVCKLKCRFDAILLDKTYKVDAFACEGCGVCEALCPAGAISLQPSIGGKLKLYNDERGVFSTAQLKMGSGTSGLLVTEVKKQMKEAISNVNLAIIDGSPGIGCPVIASVSGVDIVLVVAEPSISGISDMERIIETANKLGTESVICVNKYDVNIENTEKIEALCKKRGLAFMGRIPFDFDAVRAINNGHSIVDIDCPSGNAVKEVYNKTIKFLSQKY